jgi:phosphonate transport system substrate-binding protein
MRASRLTLALALAFAGAALASALPGTAAAADDAWKAEFKTVRFGVLSGENEKDRRAAYGPFRDYLKRELGVDVKIYTASSYAGVTEALAANQIEFAFLGSSAYAAAWESTGGKVEPLLSRLQKDGSTGYYSIVVVKTDSPYKTIDDLKGKTLAFADPNSTSGYNVPYFKLLKEGYTPEKFFGRIPFSGSHETGVLGVVNGQYDAATTYRTNELRGIPSNMVDKGMIPANSVRVIWTSPEITSGPFTARSNLPAGLKKRVSQLVFDVPNKDPAAFEKMAKGQKGWIRVDHKRYEWIVEMRKEIRKLRRKRDS